MIKEVQSEAEMKSLGAKLASLFQGGEVLELVGDVGAGKTTLTKGIAAGLGVNDDVQSPSFTISRIYPARDGLQLAHYDFYRLSDAGILNDELVEVSQDPKTILVIEWAEIVNGVLPADRLSLHISAIADTVRRVEIIAGGIKSKSVLDKLI